MKNQTPNTQSKKSRITYALQLQQTKTQKPKKQLKKLKVYFNLNVGPKKHQKYRKLIHKNQLLTEYGNRNIIESEVSYLTLRNHISLFV